MLLYIVSAYLVAIYTPEQTKPLPVVPLWHEQTYDPGVLVHFERSEQLWLPVWHSSWSENTTEIIVTNVLVASLEPTLSSFSDVLQALSCFGYCIPISLVLALWLLLWAPFVFHGPIQVFQKLGNLKLPVVYVPHGPVILLILNLILFQSTWLNDLLHPLLRAIRYYSYTGRWTIQTKNDPPSTDTSISG